MEFAELAQNNFGDTRSGSLAGPVAGFIIALLAVVTILLIRNMNARLRRLPERFPERSPDPLPDRSLERFPERSLERFPDRSGKEQDGSDPGHRTG